MGSVTGGRPLRRVRRVRRVTAACLTAPAVALLVACGPPTSTSASEPATSSAPTESGPDDAGPAGPDAGSDIEALDGFVCGPRADGSWSAKGTLTNTEQKDAWYVLTIVVTGPDSTDSTTVAAKRQVVAVPGGASEPIRFGNLPVTAEGELSCQAQVVRR